MDKQKYHTNRLIIEIHEDMLVESFKNLYYEIEIGYRRAVDLKIGVGGNGKKFIEMTLECDIMFRDTAYEKFGEILNSRLSTDTEDFFEPLQEFANELGLDNRTPHSNSAELIRDLVNYMNRLPVAEILEKSDD